MNTDTKCPHNFTITRTQVDDDMYANGKSISTSHTIKQCKVCGKKLSEYTIGPTHLKSAKQE